MANVKNTLYPPQLNTFQPAFICDEVANIYFSLSPYNEVAPKKIHISVVQQSNNRNALKSSVGILVRPWSEVIFDENIGLYKFSLYPEKDLEGNKFQINQMYKVQLRFDSNEKVIEINGDPLNPKDVARATVNYLLDDTNKLNFSEWSNVSLLRPISRPTLTIDTFNSENFAGMLPSFPKGIIPIQGQVSFEDSNDTETLQSFQIQILDESGTEVLYQTSNIYTGENLQPNSIFYRLSLQELPSNINEGAKLKMRFICITKNQYKLPVKNVTKKLTDEILVPGTTYNFAISAYIEEDDFRPKTTVSIDNENGVVVLDIENNRDVIGLLYVKRSSSLSNFTEWEDIYQCKVKGPIKETVIDNTVSSLVWYKYSVQLENSKGGLSDVKYIPESGLIIPDFYDAIISRGSAQLKIKYNYNISSMKPVVNRAKIDTLGGRYPKFAENANMNYKQFSISGLMTAMNDNDDKFLDREKYFGKRWEDYLTYNKVDSDTYTSLPGNDIHGNQNRIWKDPDQLDTRFGYGYKGKNGETSTFINQQAFERNDFFWEREFREAALKWLNDGEPKLYRSMAEGNIAVMITDISLTPNTQLGRRIWNFSATMYEIENGNSLEVLENLGIVDINRITQLDKEALQEDEAIVVARPFQIYNQKIIKPNQNIITNDDDDSIDLTKKLNSLYTKGILYKKEIVPGSVILKNVKIYFHNKPNLFTFLSSEEKEYLEKQEYIGNRYGTPQWHHSISPDENYHYGYKFSITTKEVRTTLDTATSNKEQTITQTQTREFFVNEKGYYQLPNKLDIYSLYFDKDDIVTVEGIIVYKEKINTNEIAKNNIIDNIVLGQESGIFKPYNYLGEKIKNKYNYIVYKNNIEKNYSKKMTYWNGINVDVDPYTIIHIKYKGDSKFNDYIVGQTRILNLLKNTPIEDMCFIGKRMVRRSFSRQNYLKDWEFVVEDENEWLNDSSSIEEGTVNWLSLDTGANLGQVWFKTMTDEEIDDGTPPIGAITTTWLDDNSYSSAIPKRTSVKQIKSPKLNTVYKVGDKYKIYYHYNWYDFEKASLSTGLGFVPVEGQLNYYAKVIKSYY